MKLDILVLAAHPDDAELGCGGTIARQIALGNTVGIVDLTRGELGTRGSVAIREQEAHDSARIMKVSIRENLGLRDGFFTNSEDDQLKVVAAIRKFQPEIILANAISDRHPDHGRGASLAFDSFFLSGLAKVETKDNNGNIQTPWRPKSIYHYIQSEYVQPDFVVDVSEYWDVKMEAIRAFKSQFYDPSSQEKETYISNPNFLKKIEGRGVDWGHTIGVQYGEGFTTRRLNGIADLFHLI